MATTRARSRKASMAPVSLLRWTFSKGTRTITCQIDNRPGAEKYDVCVVPHWDVASTIVEGSYEPIGAFTRHAEFARRLRAAGWSRDRRAY